MPTGDVAALWARYGDAVLAGLLNFAGALAILLGGLWFAGIAARSVRRMLKRSERIDETLGAFVASIVRYAILAVVVLAVLNRFGVETTSLVAVLGAATLAIGLALQGTLSNVAAGVMLVLFRPYKLGDFVQIGGQMGVVRNIDLFTTELSTLQNVRIVAPNGKVWGEIILNFSHHDTRRIDLLFSIAYSDDIAQARGVIEAVLASDPRVLKDPAPWVKVSALAASSVDIAANFWVNSADWLNTRAEMIEAVKLAFDRAGLTIPYPTQTAITVEARSDRGGQPRA